MVKIDFRHKVDKELQDILRPIDLLQTAALLKKFRIENNFVKSNSNLAKLITLLGVLIMIFLHILDGVVAIYNAFQFKKSVSSFILQSTMLVFHLFGILLNMTINFIHSKNNVQIIVKLQSVRQLTKGLKNDSRKIMIWNWFHTIANIALSIGNIYFFWELFGLSCVGGYVMFYFDVNLVYATEIIRLIRSELEILTTRLKQECEHHDSLQKLPRKIMQESCKLVKLSFKELFRAYLDIFDVFDKFKKASQVMVNIFLIGCST